MKVAIMQPYLFPYIGYFQLIHAVDAFVIYDDVNFIKGGWIHRNRILMNGQPIYFSIPLKKRSSFIAINNTEINQDLFDKWKMKFLKSLQISYGKAPYYIETVALIEGVLNKHYLTISDLAIQSVQAICEILSVKTNILVSSKDFYNTKPLPKTERLINITKDLQGDTYVNPIGGLELYHHDDFNTKNIQLLFLKSNPIAYKQFENNFMPWLSIIDVMMFNSKDTVKSMLNEYTLE